MTPRAKKNRYFFTVLVRLVEQQQHNNSRHNNPLLFILHPWKHCFVHIQINKRARPWVPHHQHYHRQPNWYQQQQLQLQLQLATTWAILRWICEEEKAEVVIVNLVVAFANGPVVIRGNEKSNSILLPKKRMVMLIHGVEDSKVSMFIMVIPLPVVSRFWPSSAAFNTIWRLVTMI